jgi:hypothetical protein
MAVTTKTQTEQTHTKASSDTESTKPGEQLLRDELKEASQPGTEASHVWSPGDMLLSPSTFRLEARRCFNHLAAG